MHPYFQVSADAGQSGGGAGHCYVPVGTDDLRLAEDGSPVQPLPETSTFLCGKPAIRKRPRHRLLSLGDDDLRLPEDGATVAVSSGQLHLSLWKACAPEVSADNFRLKRNFYVHVCKPDRK